MPPVVLMPHASSSATAIWWVIFIALEWVLAALAALIGVLSVTTLSNRRASGTRLQQHVHRYLLDTVIPLPGLKTRREFHAGRAREPEKSPLPAARRAHAVVRLSEFRRGPHAG